MEDWKVGRENYNREGWQEQKQRDKEEKGKVSKGGRLGIQAGENSFTVFLWLATWLLPLYSHFCFAFCLLEKSIKHLYAFEREGMKRSEAE